MTEPEAHDSPVSRQEPSDEETFAPTLDRAQALGIVARRLELLVGGIRLSKSGISRLARYLDTEQFAAGEVILQHGERGDFMGLVGAGQVAVYNTPEDAALTLPDDSVLALILQPGSTFGEAMLLDGRPCGSTLAALSGTELYVLHRDDYLAVAAQRSSRPRRPSNPWWLWLLPLVLLAVVALSVAAIYLTSALQSGVSLHEIRDILPVSPSLREGAVQVIKPEAGQVIQGSQSILVQAMLSEPGVLLAELEVDGWPQGRLANDDPDAASWLPEWAWEDASSGSHVLAIRASPGGGAWQTSAPITVTVVPSGTLAFTSNREGPYAVYTMSSDGRRLTRLTAGPGDTRQPAWGTADSLAFVVDPEHGPSLIRQSSVSGLETMDLTAGRDPAWAADGARLAYASAVEGVSQVLVSAEGDSSPEQVTEEEIYAGQPTWSPDGTLLAYVADRDDNWDLWTVAPDGSEPQRLTTDPAMDWAPAWSPDGRYLAFVSNRGGSHQIHMMPAGGGSATQLTSLPQGTESPTWSPDGLWLAFVAYTGDGVGVSAREIYLMRASGQDQVRLTFNAFDDSAPQWRPAP